MTTETTGAAGPGRGGRMSRRRKRDAVLRLMGEHDLLAPSRVGAPRGPRTHDGTIIPETVDIMWGTDLTTTWLIERHGFRPPSAVRQDQLSTAALAA